MKSCLLQRLRKPCLMTLGAAALVTANVTAAQTNSGRNLAPSDDRPAITRRETPLDDSGDYRQELQACRSGETAQAASNCLKEARHARAAKRQGALDTSGEDFMANALARCEPFSGEDRAACEARVMGFGNASGSVAGGGLLRWVETVVLPPSEGQITFTPKTAEPVVLIPPPKD